MFCYQCEQTAQGTGCTQMGVCGKQAETSDLQDLLLHLAKGISQYGYQASLLRKQDPEVNHYVVESLFTTITNVNFDSENLKEVVQKGLTIRESAKRLYENAALEAGKAPESFSGPASFHPEFTTDGIARQAEEFGVKGRLERMGADASGVYEIGIYGLKGLAAYLDHARVLGKEDPEIYQEVFRILADYAEEKQDLNHLLTTALEVGALNLKVMALLDEANTSTYGNPEPTKIRVTAVKGKAILVSGHDLKDLAMLLEQTEGKGINIYTHGEMLPCLAYPELKKYSHLVGNYGGAWQDQQKEFEAFPGAILMTTNCIQKPRENYMARIFTTGLVEWPGVLHIGENGKDKDFTPVIESALAAPGFTEDESAAYSMTGFGHHAVLSAADTVVKLVKEGKLRHFFLVGGCDGAKSGRNYYTDIATMAPKDTVILTLACGKYRFNKLEFGDIEGLPRLLDMGQCNDAYSAIRVAVALAEAFETDVNSLPLSLILSWYEQKAVAILLTLLHLGIKNIRIGPSLPAFVSPAALGILNEKFNLMPITTAEADLKAILG